jgi:hypothetical protein
MVYGADHQQFLIHIIAKLTPPTLPSPVITTLQFPLTFPLLALLASLPFTTP